MGTEEAEGARKAGAPLQSCLFMSISRSKVNTAAGTSEAFDVKVGVHQGSALSPQLFIIVMEKATKLARGNGPWQILCADDLELTAESKEEVADMFNRWEEEMEQRGLKINMEKTKLIVTGNKAREGLQSGRWLALWMLWKRSGSN